MIIFLDKFGVRSLHPRNHEYLTKVDITSPSDFHSTFYYKIKKMWNDLYQKGLNDTGIYMGPFTVFNNEHSHL